MRVLIEVRAGSVTNVWCEQPEGVEVIVRDMDEIDCAYYDVRDPVLETPGVAELRTPYFVVY